jgi:hypothetical protein
MNKIDKPLSKLTKERHRRPKLIKIRVEMGNITTKINEIQRIIREYFENLHSDKPENL